MIPFGCLIPAYASAALNAAIMALSPWGYWPLSEGSGATQASDSSGNARHLTTTVGIAFGSTPLVTEGAYSADFSPADVISGEYAAVSTTVASTAFGADNQPISFFCLARYDAFAHQGTLMHVGELGTAGYRGWRVYLFPGDSKIYVEFHTGAGVQQYAATVAISTGVTYSIGFIRTAAGNLQMYLNGAASGSPDASAGGVMQVSNNASSRIVIGAAAEGVYKYGIDGRMQHVAAFTSDIGAAAMTDLHTATGL